MLVALSIAGTAETIFWASWLWRKFAPETEPVSDEEEEEEEEEEWVEEVKKDS